MLQDTRTDMEIVQEVLKTPESFGILIDRYSEKLSRYIHRITNISREDGEDILQDVFIKAYRNLLGYDARQSFSSWIYRIAHNTVISAYRKSSVRPQTQFSALPDVLIASFASELETDTLVIDTDRLRTVRDALERLDIKYREVLVLHYFESYSYQEISDIIQKPSGTVATRINRAKKKLVTLLEDTI